MRSISSIYFDLCNKVVEHDGYFPVEKLPFSEYFYIGISDNSTPMFLLHCEILDSPNDIILEYVKVLYNKKCRIIDNDNKSEITCTIILLNENNYDFQDYFLEVISLLLKQISAIPSSSQIKNEITKIIKLFSSTTHPATKTIQGLWAELLLIEQSKNPAYLLKAWHSKSHSKYDFNDGENKIEVKSTSSSKREHTFSFDQLTANENSKLLIASVKTMQTGIGKNIGDLRESIFKRINDIQLQSLLDSIIFECLGMDINKVFDIQFDYQTAIDELKFFDSELIPKIQKDCIPLGVTNIKFNSDLTLIENQNLTNLETSPYTLFKSL